MQTNEAGLKLIKGFEGLRLRAHCRPSGTWEIGYRHTRTAKPGQVITEAEADRLLREDLREFEEGVEKVLKGAPTTSNQFSAMVSLAFDVGIGAFRWLMVPYLHKQGQTAKAACAFTEFDAPKSKIPPEIIRRREAQAKLYLTPD
jgi:lysozyme